MALFMVSHELRRPRESYGELWDTLDQQAALQVMPSSWLVRTAGSPTRLLDLLLPLVGQDDRLLIAQVADALAWANPMTDPSKL